VHLCVSTVKAKAALTCANFCGYAAIDLQSVVKGWKKQDGGVECVGVGTETVEKMLLQ